MRVTLLACAALVLGLAGCGNDVEPIAEPVGPAVTSPGTTIPFENGGADGSGSDGRIEREDSGGVAAGHDAGTP
jgi:hypothetical protein